MSHAGLVNFTAGPSFCSVLLPLCRTTSTHLQHDFQPTTTAITRRKPTQQLLSFSDNGLKEGNSTVTRWRNTCPKHLHKLTKSSNHDWVCALMYNNTCCKKTLHEHMLLIGSNLNSEIIRRHSKIDTKSNKNSHTQQTNNKFLPIIK